jgi:hypothetical protein
MDGAKSELIVPSGHGAHQNSRAIEEVYRILVLNARSGDRLSVNSKLAAKVLRGIFQRCAIEVIPVAVRLLP